MVLDALGWNNRKPNLHWLESLTFICLWICKFQLEGRERRCQRGNERVSTAEKVASWCGGSDVPHMTSSDSESRCRVLRLQREDCPSGLDPDHSLKFAPEILLCRWDEPLLEYKWPFRARVQAVRNGHPLPCGLHQRALSRWWGGVFISWRNPGPSF